MRRLISSWRRGEGESDRGCGGSEQSRRFSISFLHMKEPQKLPPMGRAVRYQKSIINESKRNRRFRVIRLRSTSMACGTGFSILETGPKLQRENVHFMLYDVLVPATAVDLGWLRKEKASSKVIAFS